MLMESYGKVLIQISYVSVMWEMHFLGPWYRKKKKADSSWVAVNSISVLFVSLGDSLTFCEAAAELLWL